MEHAQWDQAEQLFSRAVTSCPEDSEARQRYAEALWHRGARAEALAQLEEAGRLSPDDMSVRVRMAELRLEAGQLAAARGQIEQALDLEPKSAPAWMVRGRIMQVEGNYQQALADYHRALSYSPDNRQILLAVAETYRLLHQPDRALVTLQALADTYAPGEEPQQVLYLTGLAYAATGRHGDAVEMYAAALNRPSPTPELLTQLAQSQFQLGRTNEAASAAQQALALDPNQQACRDMLARLASPQGMMR